MYKLEAFIDEFFPEYFKYISTEIMENTIILNFSTNKRNLICPACGKVTFECATYYTRKIQDLPILDKSTYVKLKLKKMKCNNNLCKVNYFNEPLDDYVIIKKRYSNRLIDLLVKISLTNSAEGGSRILKESKINISGDKLLQLAKEYKPYIDNSKVISIGVDDFALKKNIKMELFL